MTIKTISEKVREELARNPFATNVDLATKAGCSVSYAGTIAAPLRTQGRSHPGLAHPAGALLAHSAAEMGLGEGVHPGLMAEVENLTPRDTTKGSWEIEDGYSERISEHVTRFSLDGVPTVRARNGAAIAAYREKVTAEDVAEKLALNVGKKVTALVTYPGGTIRAYEVTVSTVFPDGTPHLLLKRNPTNAWSTNNMTILDVEKGYNKQGVLAEKWAEHKAATTPAVEKLDAITSFDDLPTYNYTPGEEPPNDIAAVYLVQHPGFGDGPINGAMFLATDVQQGDGPNGDHIVNGYFYVPPGQDGVSEHGSFYSGDLAKWGGKVTAYKPGTVTFDDCFNELEDADREAVYRRVLGQTAS